MGVRSVALTCAVIVEWGWYSGRHSLSCSSSEGHWRLNPYLKLWMIIILSLLTLYHVWNHRGLLSSDGRPDHRMALLELWYYGIPHLRIMPTKPLSQSCSSSAPLIIMHSFINLRSNYVCHSVLRSAGMWLLTQTCNNWSIKIILSCLICGLADKLEKNKNCMISEWVTQKQWIKRSYKDDIMITYLW